MIMVSKQSKSNHFDVIVVGAGAIGMATSMLLHKQGLSVALIGKAASDTAQTYARTIAVLEGSLKILYSLDPSGALRLAIEEASAPLKSLRLIDKTGSVFHAPTVRFEAAELGLEAFGRNIPLAMLTKLLQERIAQTSALVWHQTIAQKIMSDFDQARLILDDGMPLYAKLIIAADGANSKIRTQVGIKTREQSFPQLALTAILEHNRDHQFCSTEFHTRDGPMTFVPLPQTESGSYRSSLVWLQRPQAAREAYEMSDEALATHIFKANEGFLGKITLEQSSQRGLVPMRALAAKRLISERVALVGEAAHTFPPIGAQGFNLSLRDGFALASLISKASTRGGNIGAGKILASYERARLPDILLRNFGVNGLNKSLLAGFAPIDGLRAFGVSALKTIKPLRQVVMQAGMGTPFGIKPFGMPKTHH